ncbi:MAG TPA: MFS transporter [Caulobacteraceae bacterium]|jgi:Na+/melibiose symporter-like transporter|nr:MFS transporter [Caulobacteraceae bacterium]
MSQVRTSERAAATSEKPPSAIQLILFAFPALPHAFIALPLNIVIPTYYAAHTSVTLLQIGAATSFSRLFDAFTDPLIGFLSDRSKSRFGKRKPWVLGGALICSVSIFFLFRPPAEATIVYYAVWSFLLYFGFTLFEIPRNAWGAEINREYLQRSRINTYVAVFNIAGSLVFWVAPLALSGLTGTTQITGDALTAIAWLYVILMPAGLLLAVLFVPRGSQTDAPGSTVTDLLRSFRGNRPLHTYLGAIVCWGLGQGALLSTLMIFLGDRMKLADIFPMLMIGFFAVQILAMPVWVKIAARIGRHRAWALGLASDALFRPLVLLLPTGGDAWLGMTALVCLSAFCAAPANFAPPALLGDVIDYDLWKTKANKAANFFAFNTLLIKATMAVGAGAAFALLDVFHYRVGGPNTASAQLGLLICYMLAPGALALTAAAFAWFFPLDARRQSLVRRRLERRGAMESQPGAGLVPGLAAEPA